MSKKIRFIKAEPGTEDNSNLQVTNWKLCCLCQKEDGNPLQCPVNSKNNKSGYESLAINLLEFKKIESLPISICLARLDDGRGIAETLLFHKAVYHKSCYLKFANDKLKRAQKKASTMSVTVQTSPKKTRRSLDTSMQEPKCFFCNELGGEMHRASTKNIDSRVRECAVKLNDTSLLAKLATSDMHALDAQYHRKCLVALYNRMHKHCKNETNLSGNKCMSVEAVALAEIVSYMEESGEDDYTVPVFKLSDLIKLYTERLKQLGVEVSDRINSTRFKERLLAAVPNLRAHTNGKEVLLTYNNDVGTAIGYACESNFDSDAMILAKAAKIVCREIFKQKRRFIGSFNKDCQKTSVPDALLNLIRMILEGPNIKHQTSSEGGRSYTACVLSQLIIFNSALFSNSSHSEVVRHDIDKETPLPIYLGLMLHAATRKRDLVEKLHKFGLSISYDRLLQISADLANTVCRLYEEEGVVCPPNLKKHVFTTAAVDNIDHNPSSTTASDSFHGTAVSLTNHLSDTCTGVDRDVVHITRMLPSKAVMNIPSSYSTFPPATLQNKHPMVPQVQGYANPTGDSVSEARKNEQHWLSKVGELLDKDHFDKDDCMSWAAYYATTQPTSFRKKANIAVLPLFQENAQSVAMIKHAMNITKNAIQHLNPQQVPVIAMDQPLYALAKQIQWSWSDLGEESFVIMLGGLHIEMAVLSMLGKWLEGSGWSSALVEAGIATSGKAEALISASHVKRTRYAHQVTAAALHVLQDTAYKSYCMTLEEVEVPLSFTAWCSEKAEQYPQFYYWSLVVELELLMNMYIRSLREGNFILYIDTLNQLAPWFFALDHVHYARWLPIHIRDMVTLKTMHPSVYNEFEKGNFVVKRSLHTFSCMALDQSHEQSNKCIKGDGGVVGLTEDPAALRRWMLAGPEISRVVAEFEESMDDGNIATRHHEQTAHYQTAFAKDVNSLVAVFDELGNPFLECSKELLTLTTKDIMDEEAVTSILSAKKLGVMQHEAYVANRIVNSKLPITDTLTRNNLPLFHSKPKKKKSALKTVALKKDCQLFSRLYIACQSREADLKQFFAHENQPIPPSLSSSGRLRIGTKSDLLPCLEALGENVADDYMTGVTVKIIDGAAIVNMRKPKLARNFGEYADDNLIPFFKSQLADVERLDVVWDQYLTNSLKEQARMARGEGPRRRVQDTTSIPKNWANFLHNSENKKELFCFLSEKLVKIDVPNKEVYTTHLNNVLSTNSTHSESNNEINPCNHEEADTRMILHAAHAAKHGHRKVVLRTVDTDVVVLAIAQMHNLHLSELWLEFGVGKHHRVIPVHSIALRIGPEKASALPFFHALTGCDTTSAFAGRGKKTAWDIWNVFSEITPILFQTFLQTLAF